MRTGKAYHENVDDFKGCVALRDRIKVNILIDDWHDLEGDLKDSIWTYNTLFIMNLFIYLFGLILISTMLIM